MKLLGSTKKDVDKGKDGEDVSKLESVEVVLMHCNLVNNSYQQASKVLLTMLKTTNTEVQSFQLWFTDQNNRSLEIEDYT